MSFAERRVDKSVLVTYSDMLYFWARDSDFAADDLEELLVAVKKAEKLIDDAERKAEYEAVAIKCHSLYLGLIMINMKIPAFQFPSELMAPLHSIFSDAAVTGIPDGRWPQARYKILAYLEARDLLTRVEDYDWFRERDPSRSPEPEPLDVEPDVREHLKSIYKRDPQKKRNMMLEEFRNERRIQEKSGIRQTDGLRILREIERMGI